MICAMAHAALIGAARHGKDCTSFRGFRIDANRVRTDGGEGTLIEVTLSAAGGAALLDRVLIEVARHAHLGSACAIEPTAAGPVAPRRTAFLAGCVSPFDARYASPETGQIS